MDKEITFNGCRMFIDDSMHSGRAFEGNGLNYEKHVRRELERLIPSATTFWDCGANAGLHTVSAKQINPEVRCVCFEPYPSIVALLMQTVFVNSWKDVIVVPMAVGDRDGLIGGNEGDPGNLHLGEYGDPYLAPFPMIRLDSLDLPLPEVMKLDVEGWELDTLQSATKLMASKPIIIAEFCPELLTRRGRPEALVDFFIARGYKATILELREGMRKVVQSGAEALTWTLHCCEGASGVNADIMYEPL